VKCSAVFSRLKEMDYSYLSYVTDIARAVSVVKLVQIKPYSNIYSIACNTRYRKSDTSGGNAGSTNKVDGVGQFGFNTRILYEKYDL